MNFQLVVMSITIIFVHGGTKGGIDMNVYVVIEECSQEDCLDPQGHPAESCSCIAGIYKDRERAEYERDQLNEQSARDREINGYDPYSYYVDERPVLE